MKKLWCVQVSTKSTMPRRFKGSIQNLFSGHFFGSDFFLSGPTFFVVNLDASGFKTVTIRSSVKNPI